jgi:hypothetical protein
VRSLSSSGRTGTFVPTLEGDIRLELPSSRFDTPDGAFPEDGNVWEEGKAAGNPWPTALLFAARNNRSKWHAHVDRGCYIIYKRMQRPAYRSDRPVRFQHLSLFFPFTLKLLTGK